MTKLNMKQLVKLNSMIATEFFRKLEVYEESIVKKEGPTVHVVNCIHRVLKQHPEFLSIQKENTLQWLDKNISGYLNYNELYNLGKDFASMQPKFANNEEKERYEILCSKLYHQLENTYDYKLQEASQTLDDQDVNTLLELFGEECKQYLEPKIRERYYTFGGRRVYNESPKGERTVTRVQFSCQPTSIHVTQTTSYNVAVIRWIANNIHYPGLNPYIKECQTWIEVLYQDKLKEELTIKRVNTIDIPLETGHVERVVRGGSTVSGDNTRHDVRPYIYVGSEGAYTRTVYNHSWFNRKEVQIKNGLNIFFSLEKDGKAPLDKHIPLFLVDLDLRECWEESNSSARKCYDYSYSKRNDWYDVFS